MCQYTLFGSHNRRKVQPFILVVMRYQLDIQIGPDLITSCYGYLLDSGYVLPSNYDFMYVTEHC